MSTGECDVVWASATITEECKQSMDFSDPYFEATQMILVHVIQYFASNNQSVTFRTMVNPSFEKEEYGFVMKKDRNDELLPTINAGLKNICENGT